MLFATVCVHGDRLVDSSSIKDRVKLLKQTSDEIQDKKAGLIDVLLLPGGFFNHGHHIGNLDFYGRKKQLERNPFSAACTQVSHTTGAVVIAGVDTKPSSAHECDDIADQLCVAWDGNGIVSIGKKVFPTADEGYDMGCYIEDYSSPHRLVTLKNGEKTILCACYDMFGCADYASMKDTREEFIQNLCDYKGHYFYDGVTGFIQERQKAVRSFWQLIRSNSISKAFVAIHHFHSSGRDNRWQTYGIDGAAKALKGCAFGAAHYTNKLPSLGAKLTLASTRKNKYTHATAPIYEFYTCGGKALVRLFSI
jgi:hypothetical protein